MCFMPKEVPCPRKFHAQANLRLLWIIRLFSHALAEQFVNPAHRQMVLSDRNYESLVKRLLEYKLPLVDK